jgi:DNA polymerase-3 subunit gamma/tau
VHSHFIVSVFEDTFPGSAMGHISLYRKWRPQTFEEVVGQRHVTSTLGNALSSGRLVHAYLFAGPRGTGKTSTARILAKAINCVEGPTAVPCNKCEACVSISEGTALDVIEIDAASNRKIDEIRDLLEKIPYTPTSLRTKVYIVDEVHQLTPEASSALLKTLEEPPGHVVFVLATTESHKLLPTIISRCQRFDFSLVQPQDVARLLEHIASHEGIDVETEAIEMIAEYTRGSVRDAIGVMDQISSLEGERVTRARLAELLGEVETELVFLIVDMLAERDTPGALSLIGRLVDGGKDPRRFVESLITHLRNMFLIQNAANPREIVEATSDHFERLSEQTNALSRHEVIKLIESFGAAHRDMRWSEYPRLELECAVVKNTSLDADVSLEGLVFRIEELERKVDSLSGAGTASGVIAGETSAGLAENPERPAKKAPHKKSDAGREPARKPKKSAPAGGEKAIPGPTGKPAEEPHPAPQEGGAGPKDREKVRRAWMAVLADLKKAGNMKLYALLTKVRVRGAGADHLVLVFPEDARFQMEMLAASRDDVELIEETWQRFMEQPVKVELTTATSREMPDGAAKKTPAYGAKKAGPSVGEAGAQDVPGKGPEDSPEAEDPGKAQKKSSSREIARLISERFDGEIIDTDKEGKD